MEKLIELLNEFEKHISLWWLADWREFYWNLHYYSNYKDEYVFDNVYYRIISKNYWFIKWLVENEKISYNKVPEHRYVSDYSFETIHEWMTDNILMWLAIQDKPIEFLISILK